MITLFLNTGMRLSELAGISLEDMDSELRSLRVIGKEIRSALYILMMLAAPLLSEYLPIRVAWPVKDKNERALFLSSQNKKE